MVEKAGIQAAIVCIWAGLTVAPALGGTITPTADTYLDARPNTYMGTPEASLPHDATNLAARTPAAQAGVVVKGQTGNVRTGLLQFDIPNIPIFAASLNLYYVKSFALSATPWHMNISGKQATFPETTITQNNRGSILNSLSTIATGIEMEPGVAADGSLAAPLWKTFDMTAFFNANKGTTVTIVLQQNTNLDGTNSGATGAVFEDRENSRGFTDNGPYISYTETPEPTAALLLLGGLPMLRRRHGF